ncbi:hypothetical protein [Pararobbsia alpina]|uniref:Uncharacterized protein n=1 Tax=Pararobbsia alpina TaxID=621374 RepID=A0A6S7BVH6_9BURK|nr:hypothetical protein [Pararobbsia alpina]CAB3804352.1 hypothetical protein LMG28138_05499 [Pararobbsia alpina]
MTRHDLEFHFKGRRDYVQGPDMLNEVGKTIRACMEGSLTGLDFAVHRMTHHNLALELAEGEAAPQAVDAVATLGFEVRGVRWNGRLVERAEMPVERIAYDEARVLQVCSLDAQARIIELKTAAPFSPIETIVSMNKALHVAVFPGTTQPWVFCRWRGPSWPLPEDLAGCRVQIRQAIGTRFTRSSVSLGETVIGQIDFSLRSPT